MHLTGDRPAHLRRPLRIGVQLRVAAEGVEREIGNVDAIVLDVTVRAELHRGQREHLQRAARRQCERLEATEGVAAFGAVHVRVGRGQRPAKTLPLTVQVEPWSIGLDADAAGGAKLRAGSAMQEYCARYSSTCDAYLP